MFYLTGNTRTNQTTHQLNHKMKLVFRQYVSRQFTVLLSNTMYELPNLTISYRKFYFYHSHLKRIIMEEKY